MTQEEGWLLSEKYNGVETADFFTDIERLKSGEPLAYIIGHVPFLGTQIFLDDHPLIPRPETEFWVEKIIARMEEKSTPARVLDLCAGSGCIGIAVLSRVKNALVDFVEIDERVHTTITRNLEENNIDTSRTNILGGNLFEHVRGTYDYILSNPPYIDPVIDRTDKSVRAHEPHLALYGGLRGTELIAHIIREAPTFLTSHGTLVIEHEPEQVEEIRSLASQNGLASVPQKDQYGIVRYTVFTRDKVKSMAP
jgi:release factor glutamine methyltransferase